MRAKGIPIPPRDVKEEVTHKTASSEDKKKMDKMAKKYGMSVNDPKQLKE